MIEIEAPSEFVCPLTLDVMDDPIMTKYGQSYERSALLEWLQSGHGVCPLSRRPLHLQDIVTNHGLRMKVEEWRKDNGEDAPVVVKPANPLQIYGFITLPSKDDYTDRTLGEDEGDLFFLQLAAMRLEENEEVPSSEEATVLPQPGDSTVGRRRTLRTRRASTGSAAPRPITALSPQTNDNRRSSTWRPFKGLRKLFAGSNRNASL